MKKQRMTAYFLILSLLLFSLASCQKKFLYHEHLSEVILTLDGNTEYTLRDAAFYVWYEEYVGDFQARMYDENNPRSYWNAHVNGNFMSVLIKDATLNMFLHDTVVYLAAAENETVLTEEEETDVYNITSTYYNSLSQEQIEALGINFQDFYSTVEKMAIAKKYMLMMCEKNSTDTSTWETDGIAYQALLSEHDYTVNEKLWEQVDIGRITLTY